MPMTRWLFRIVPGLAGGNASAICHKTVVMHPADMQWSAPLCLHCILWAQYKCPAIIIIVIIKGACHIAVQVHIHTLHVTLHCTSSYHMCCWNTCDNTHSCDYFIQHSTVHPITQLHRLRELWPSSSSSSVLWICRHFPEINNTLCKSYQYYSDLNKKIDDKS